MFLGQNKFPSSILTQNYVLWNGKWLKIYQIKSKHWKAFFDGKIKLRVIFIPLGGKTVLTSIKIYGKLITDDRRGLNVHFANFGKVQVKN